MTVTASMALAAVMVTPSTRMFVEPIPVAVSTPVSETDATLMLSLRHVVARTATGAFTESTPVTPSCSTLPSLSTVAGEIIEVPRVWLSCARSQVVEVGSDAPGRRGVALPYAQPNAAHRSDSGRLRPTPADSVSRRPTSDVGLKSAVGKSDFGRR